MGAAGKDGWRFRGGDWEKAPFLVMSGLSCLVTVVSQGRALAPVAGYPMMGRVENAFISYARYLGKMLWPVDLALPYPYTSQWPLFGWAWR